MLPTSNEINCVKNTDSLVLYRSKLFTEQRWQPQPERSLKRIINHTEALFWGRLSSPKTFFYGFVKYIFVKSVPYTKVSISRSDTSIHIIWFLSFRFFRYPGLLNLLIRLIFLVFVVFQLNLVVLVYALRLSFTRSLSIY